MKLLTLISLIFLASFGLLIWLQSQNKTSTVDPMLFSSKTLGINQWFPKNILGVQINPPQITAKAAIFIDTKTGQVFYSKNAHLKLPIASLTKMMTTLVALEYRGLNEEFTVSDTAAAVEPDKMYLIPGEKLTLKDLLYGVFLISANDAAELIAENTTGRREEFLGLMNSKAVQLGMKNTYFANPTGLDEDADNSYSTAFDLALLTRYITRNFPEVVDISRTAHKVILQTDRHQSYDLYSGINLLTTYPGVVGFKTGFTPQAGLTLITLARKDGHEVVGVILGSENRREEAKELLDYSFGQI